MWEKVLQFLDRIITGILLYSKGRNDEKLKLNEKIIKDINRKSEIKRKLKDKKIKKQLDDIFKKEKP